VIAGRYRVEREVGRGGMGSVWLCHDERLGRQVAVKQVGGLPGESSMHLARALREARHSAALNHPNVVAIFDALEEGDHVLLVMEYVPSRTLDQVVREDGPLEPRHVAAIGADVADGLAAAHALGTVHRDVKPSNILVRTDDGRALIADFGIARTVGQEQLTRSGLVTGTPGYFAPELARGQEPSPASDVWALGVSLYTAVEGAAPYAEQANAIAMLNTIASEPPPVPARAGPLTPVIEHMLEHDPDDRWTMARVAASLRELATDVAEPQPAPETAPTVVETVPEPVPEPEPVPVRAERLPDTVPSSPAPEPETAPRRRVLPVLVALALVVAVVAAGWLLTRDPSDDARADRPGSAGAEKPSRDSSPKSSGSPSGGASDQSGGTSEEPSTTEPPTSESSAPEPPPGGADASSPAGVVTDYYGLLPEDTDAAWALLTPALQEKIGRGTFDGFWATIDDVRVEDASEVDDGRVEVTLTYDTGGRQEQETRQLDVEPAGDGYLISDDLGAVAPSE
jgi:serine/threonine protein kinase